MLSFARIASIALVLAIVVPGRAAGQCQCETPELLAAYLEAELVFQAAVGSVSRVHPGEGLELSLELRRSWKGRPGPGLTVWMPRGARAGQCQQALQPEGEYLFLVTGQAPIRPTGCLGALAIAVADLPAGWEAFLEAVGKGLEHGARAD